MLSRFDSFFDFKGSDTKSRFFPSEMFDGERLCVKDTAANGVFIISTSSPIESWELFAFCKYNDKVSTGDGLIQSVRTPYCTDPTFFVQPIMAVEYDPVVYSCANVYVSNTVDVVYKVTINDQVIPPTTRYLEDALFNAYSYIYLKETLLLGVNPREFRTSKAVLQMLKQMNVNVHEVHIATNTGFGELYSNF